MSKSRINVLVFPGGTENGLEIHKSLSTVKNINLISLTSKVSNHASYQFSHSIEIDDIYNSEFIRQINTVIEKNKIDYIFPANSLVINFLSEHRSVINAQIIMQNSNVIKVAASKRKTYDLLKELIKVPKTFKKIDDICNYPVFVKPDEGYGSQGAMKISSKDGFLACNNIDELIISEFLPGDEYTVECFTNSKLQTIYCSARTRERIRMGTSMHSESAPECIQVASNVIANNIVRLLGIDGLWFFQLKKDIHGELTLLEIETRVAGTMAFSRARGVNLPLLYLYQFMGVATTLKPEKYKVTIDRSLSNKYKLEIDFDYVYVDLDDTLIINNRVNTELINFLYQCINKSKRILLITKSLEKNLVKYLQEKRLYHLFDEVIWLKESDRKSDFITHKRSIFIDDSFSQRVEVGENRNIPTFDPSMIEALLDDRL